MRHKTRWLKRFLDCLPGTGRPTRRPTAGARRGPKLESLEDRLAPATHTWTGASGVNLNWSNAANWTGGAPANGEGGPIVLNFPAVAAGLKATVNDIPGLNVDQINITDSGYSFGAAAATTLNLTGSLSPAISDTTGGNSFNNPLTINLSATSVYQQSAGFNTISSAIAGPGGFTKNGSGLVFFTNGGNSYTGQTVINAGSINVQTNGALGSTASGTLVNSGGNVAFQNVAYTNAEPLQLNGTGGAFGGAMAYGGGPTSFSGPITLGSNASIGGDTGSLTLTGTIDSLGSPRSLTFFKFGGTVPVTFQGVIGGTLPLLALTQNVGMDLLTFEQNVNLGTGNSVFNESVTLSGAVTFASAGNVAFGNAAADTLTLTGGPTISISAGATVFVNAVFTANATFTVQGGGSAVFNGGSGTGGLTVSTNNVTFNTSAVSFGGNVSLTAQNAVNLNVGLSTSGTVSVLANQDGAGTQGFTMGAGSSLSTTNATAAAVSVGVGGAGNATITSITTPTAGAQVTIAAGGSILDDNNQATRITTDVLQLTAGVDIGQPLSGPLTQDIDTAANSITAATTNSPNVGTHGIWIGDTDAVTLTSVTTADGLIRITAGGTITATSVAAAGSGRNTTLIASAGNVQAGAVSSAAGNVTLTASAGSILDDGNQATVVSASGTIALTAGNGTIGAAGTGDIDLGSATLTATSSAANGNQFLRETGTALLAAANALNAGAGTIRLTAGTFRAQASAGGNAVADTSPLVVQAGATFDLNNNNETVTSLSDGGGAGGNVTLGTGTLTTGDATSTAFSGVISGAGGLTKVGTGTFTLSGLNTYTGATNVNAGTLTVTGAVNNAATPGGGLVNLNTAGVALNGSGTVKGQVVVVASNNSVAANNTRVDGVTITVPTGGTGIAVPAAATFARIGNTAGVTINGGNATSTGVSIQGSALLFNSSVLGQNVGVRVNGGRAALQGNTFTPGTGNLVTGLLVQGGGIVDAGQLAPSFAPLPNGAAGNVGYYGDITGLFSGTPLGSTGHSAGGNTFGTAGNPYSLDTSATATPNPGPNIPQAIRNLNTGLAPFGPLANGVEQSFNYGTPGPLLGRMDTTAQANTWNGNAALPLFQIEQLIFHDLDAAAVGFVTYGNPTAPAPVVVGQVTYTASVNPGLSAVQAGTSTLLAGGNLNNGQKSAVRFLQVTFSSFVFLDPNLQSPTTNRGLNLIQVNGPAFLPGNTNPALGRLIRAGVASATYNRVTGSYTVTYNFSGPGVEYGSLEDGNYTLQFNRAAIQGGGPGGPALSVAGDPFAAQAAAFHRLFGDANGDAMVDAVTDLAAFQAAYRTRIGQAAYRAYFDFLGNGIVDSVSYYQFLRRYKTKLNPDGTLSPIP